MLVSSEEAFSCLNKWSEDRALVSAMLRVGDSVALVKGLLTIEPPRIQVTGMIDGVPGPGFVMLDLTDAEFSYEDWRAAPPEQREHARKTLESFISAKLKSGGMCIVYATED